MSGGAWQYVQLEPENRITAAQTVRLLQHMGPLIHTLDWGVCGDTCLMCARLQFAAGMEVVFDDLWDDQKSPGVYQAAISDAAKIRCPSHYALEGKEK